eukprot:CAMPEP_0184650218 /NCGR_PEP_ID=MMETSP0308-20130426/7742_1 /TAXON_ID=38269 /ORGANISM="Gloeochaete witrockiana, Strain SAG 46.84" /LENGTH=532 /DNA_ID=CAMNT_0027083593 /DNA_START=219 /DNA_END=1817 /DNA_ORIENTATION=+
MAGRSSGSSTGRAFPCSLDSREACRCKSFQTRSSSKGKANLMQDPLGLPEEDAYLECHAALLPEGPLLRIFQYLDLRSKYSALGVCREWRRVLANPCLWTKLTMSEVNQCDRVIERLLQNPRFSALQEIDLPSRVGQRVIPLIVKNCLEIHSLKLWLTARYQLITLLPVFKRLQTCCLSYPQIPPQFHYHAIHDLDLEPGTWTNLRHGCFPGGLSDKGIQTLAQVAPLQSLDLCRCISLTERGILTLFQTARGLKSLVLPSHMRDPDRFSAILDSVQGNLNLTALYSDGLSDLCIDRLTLKCPKLELLYLNPHIPYRRRGSTTAMDTPLPTPWMGSCPLATLGIRACSTTVDSLVSQPSLCSRLEYLCLYMVNGFLSEDTMAALSRNCPRLIALTLNQCGRISRTSLCHLSSARFRSLTLIHCSMDYIAIEPLDGVWSCLNDLSIVRCDITFSSLISLVLGAKKLKRLMLDDHKLVEQLERALCDDLPRLEISRGDDALEGCRTCREMRNISREGICCMSKAHVDGEVYVCV